MLLVTVNAVFALIFLSFAVAAIRRALPFIRTGWYGIDAQVRQPDYRHNVHRRRAISDAGRFLIGGVLWLLAGGGAGVIGVLFTLETLRLWLATPA